MKDSPANPVLQSLETTNVLLRRILDALKKNTCEEVQYWDTQTAAKKLQISKGHVRHLIREGKLNATKIGKGSKQSHYMISRKAFEDFINQQSLQKGG